MLLAKLLKMQTSQGNGIRSMYISACTFSCTRFTICIFTANKYILTLAAIHHNLSSSTTTIYPHHTLAAAQRKVLPSVLNKRTLNG